MMQFYPYFKSKLGSRCALCTGYMWNLNWDSQFSYCSGRNCSLKITDDYIEFEVYGSTYIFYSDEVLILPEDINIKINIMNLLIEQNKSILDIVQLITNNLEFL